MFTSSPDSPAQNASMMAAMRSAYLPPCSAALCDIRSEAVTMPRWERNGIMATRTPSIGRTTPPSSGRERTAPTITRPSSSSAPPRARMVVVARHDDDRGDLRQLQEGAVDEPLGGGRRAGGVEEVAGDQHQVDALGGRGPGDLGQDFFLFAVAAAAPDGAPDVPVGGVEDLHDPEGR